MIYLDNAATTLQKPPQVGQAMISALSTLGNGDRGAHTCALRASRLVYEARCRAARLFGCSRPDHVIFTANATEALNIALNGIFVPGDHVVTTDLEHNSVLRPLYRLEQAGVISVSYVPADSRGEVDHEDFQRLIRPNTRAIVCTHASNLTGTLLELPRLGAIARRHGLLLIVDAAQTAGSIPIHMEDMGVHVLCFTGHKGLMGPQGTGGLCIGEGVEIRPWRVGGSGVQSYLPAQPADYPVRLEAGTANGPGLAGLSAALDFILETGVERIGGWERSLARRFYRGVSAIEGVAVYGGCPSQNRAAIVALNIRELDSGQAADVLSRHYDIAVRSGAHCAPRMHRALGTREQGAVRFSFSWFNTEDEVDAAIRAVSELAHEGQEG